MVGQTGQELTDIAVLEIHPLEGIDDLAVLHQHQIGVTAHQLGAEDVAHKVAQDRKSTRLNSSHKVQTRMPSSA